MKIHGPGFEHIMANIPDAPSMQDCKWPLESYKLIIMDYSTNQFEIIEPRKYFTPTPSELTIGYECEKLVCLPGEEEDWQYHRIKEITHLTEVLILSNQIRTPYLIDKDIESEGWKIWTSTSWPFLKDRFGFTKGNFFCTLDCKGSVPYISIGAMDVLKLEWIPIDPESFRVVLPCPSVNEFRYICKLLNI